MTTVHFIAPGWERTACGKYVRQSQMTVTGRSRKIPPVQRTTTSRSHTTCQSCKNATRFKLEGMNG